MMLMMMSMMAMLMKNDDDDDADYKDDNGSYVKSPTFFNSFDEYAIVTPNMSIETSSQYNDDRDVIT